jgi:hypothetical protein
LAAASLLSGCAQPDATTAGSPGPNGLAGSTNGSAEGSAAPEVLLDDQVQGQVVLVNPKLRIVTMDFPIRLMPALEQRLNVYRSGRKVGEVKVTGPSRDTIIAGDIVTGSAQIGDEVRSD